MKHAMHAFLIITIFTFCHYVMRHFWGDGWSSWLSNIDNQTDILFIPAKFTFLYGPLVAAAIVLFKQERLFESIGLSFDGFISYTLAALLCCIPMTLGYAFLSSELHLSISAIITGSVYAGFFEEVIFRAALFGVLFKYCRWDFIPAALVSSVIFGMGHIYQGNDPLSAVMAVTVTTIAGTWFAWLYCECGYRIWFPMWMHIFMNAAYGIFGMSGGAAGDLQGNLFKATAIVLSIVYVEMLIRKGKPREVVLSKLLQTRAHSAACAVN